MGNTKADGERGSHPTRIVVAMRTLEKSVFSLVLHSKINQSASNKKLTAFIETVV